jgi:hypothetical protein
MTGMKNVETAIGEHNFIAQPSPKLNSFLKVG